MCCYYLILSVFIMSSVISSPSAIATFSQVTYQTSHEASPVLSHFDAVIDAGKVGLIGDNGVGKTTLLRLITGELTPCQGHIHRYAKVSYVPQQTEHLHALSIAELLGIKDKIIALEAIANGSTKAEDFDTIGDDWLIAEKTQAVLSDYGLGHLDLHRIVATLSGGELTRLLLLRAMSTPSDCLLLDEPSNNLDQAGRNWLCEFIQTCDKHLLVISHDRQLLMHMDVILHLTPNTLSRYGGNYADFVTHFSQEQAALTRQLLDAKKTIRHNKQQIQAEREKADQRAKQGKITQKKTGGSKIIINGNKERAEKTQHAKKVQSTRLTNTANTQYQAIRSKIEVITPLAIDLAPTFVPDKKTVLDIDHISFGYHGDQSMIIDNFSLVLQGAKRIALCGNNGSGKSTLIKLIQGTLKPHKGRINIGIDTIAYLDQKASILDPNQTILENFQHFNANMPLTQAYFALAEFGFRNVAVHQIVNSLSGGEKLKAALACQLMQVHAPQLILLDEPTNHLDLRTIAHIEQALLQYQGAMIVISHDSVFLDKIGVSQRYNAPFVHIPKTI